MGFKKFIRDLTKNAWAVFIVGLIIGALVIILIRLLSYSPDRVHYHANFKVYINGQAEKFKGPVYYEEEAGATCNLDDKSTPEERVHMHDNVNDVIHVHDHAVTYGQFFANLGWVVTPDVLQTRTKVYIVDSRHPITFTINGKKIDDISNRVIGDQDRLLVSYGKTTGKTLAAEMKSVPNTAKAEDEGTDPASCGGSAPTTFSDRMKHLF